MRQENDYFQNYNTPKLQIENWINQSTQERKQPVVESNQFDV